MAKKSGKKKAVKKKQSQGKPQKVTTSEIPIENSDLPSNDASVVPTDDPTNLLQSLENNPSEIEETTLEEPIDHSETISGEFSVQLDEQVVDENINDDLQVDIVEESPLAVEVVTNNIIEQHEYLSPLIVEQVPTQAEVTLLPVEQDEEPLSQQALELEQEPVVYKEQQSEQQFEQQVYEAPVVVEPPIEPSHVAESPVEEFQHEQVLESPQTHISEFAQDSTAEIQLVEPEIETTYVPFHLEGDIESPTDAEPIIELQQAEQIIEFPADAEPIIEHEQTDTISWNQTANMDSQDESFDFLKESTGDDQMPWENQQTPIQVDEATSAQLDEMAGQDDDVSISFIEDGANPLPEAVPEASEFWNDEGNKDEMPWDQPSTNSPNVNEIEHPDSLLTIPEDNNDDSFFQKLTEEVQNKMKEETEEVVQNEEEDKFGFLEDDEDNILDEIMDDDLLDSDDDHDLSNYINKPNYEGNSSVIYLPSPQKVSSEVIYNESPQKPNPYKPSGYGPSMPLNPVAQISPNNSFSGNARLGINSFINQTPQPEEQFNIQAAEVHKKLENEKKKSDAYDFPLDLISKHTKRAPVVTQNVYTKIETTLAKHEPVASNFAMPPKIGGSNLPPSQKTSRSGSVSKNSFFAELPIQPKNSLKPEHLRNPYEAIENSPIPQNATLNVVSPAANHQPPVAKAKRNPYAPPSNPVASEPSTSSPYLKQSNHVTQPNLPNLPKLSISEVNESLPQTQYMPPPQATSRLRTSSTTKKANPYAPAEAGGHIRRFSQEPKPVDIKPNLVSVPVASTINGQSPAQSHFRQTSINQYTQPQQFGQSPVNQFNQQPVNQFNQTIPQQFGQQPANQFNQHMPQQSGQFGQQPVNQFSQSAVVNQLISPVNQYSPSSSGSMNQGFTFPDVGGKYTPGSQPSANNSMRKSTRVGRPSVSSLNDVYGSNIVTSNASSSSYKRKLVMPPGGTTKSKHAGSNSITIAPAPVVINPENLDRRQWPLFDFSAENFMSMVPISNAYGSSLCVFQVNNFKTVLKDSSLAYSFPGPLNKTKSKRKDISKWVDEKIASLRIDDIHDLAITEEQLLWNVLKLLIDNIHKSGDFTHNLDYQSLLLKLLNPSLTGITNPNGDIFDIVSIRNIAMSIKPTFASNAHRLDQTLLGTIHDLIEKGEKASALEYALGNGDWTLTMLIANQISPLAYNEMLKLYTTVNYGHSPISNDLNFFLQSTGPDGIGISSLVGKESWIVENFKTILPFIFKNSTNPGKSLFNIGELLIKSGYRVYGKIAILISGEPLVPTCSEMLPTSIDDMMIDEIYEYLLMSSENMPAQFIHGLPHMVPVKIRHAGYLADFGMVNEAKRYVSSTEADIASKLLFVEPSTNVAQQNITDMLSKLGSSWLGGISRPKLDKVWNTLDKSFTKFVSGEENVDTRKQDDGMFSKFASPSVSRIGSHLDLSQVQLGMDQSKPPLSTVNSVTSIYGAQSRQPTSIGSIPNNFNPYFNANNVGNQPAVSPQHNSTSTIMRQQSIIGVNHKSRGKYAPQGMDTTSDQVVPPPIVDSNIHNPQFSPIRNTKYAPQFQNNLPALKVTTSHPPKPDIKSGNLFNKQPFDTPHQPPKIIKQEAPVGTIHNGSTDNSRRSSTHNYAPILNNINVPPSTSPYGSTVSVNNATSEDSHVVPIVEAPKLNEVNDIKHQTVENFGQYVEPAPVDETFEEDLEDSVVDELAPVGNPIEESTPQPEEVLAIDELTPQPEDSATVVAEPTPDGEEIKTIVSPVESIISETSTNSVPPVVVRGPPTNKYATQSTKKKTGNPYSNNPYAPKASANKSTRSIYAPKEPLKPLTQSDDPLEAMGITGDVDMFAATGYQMPPPPPPQPVQEPVQESVEAEAPVEEKPKVDVIIPMMHRSEIPMVQRTEPEHLRGMFDPPNMAVSGFDEQRKSPIFTITEQKKFYAEDTGEYYDDIIDDDDEDDEEDAAAAAAAEKLRLEAERKRIEEEERKKKEAEAKKKEETSNSSTRSWFGMFGGGGNNKNEKKVYKAKLGEDNSFYYDEKLKRWINGKESVEEQLNASKPPPPPPAGLSKKQSMPSMLGSTPPIGPPSGSNSVPASKPNTLKGSDSIDDLLNRAPPPGGASSRKAKRGPRRGYVDVMAQP